MASQKMESKLLNAARRTRKPVDRDDLREKIEVKKIKMLDSRPEGVKQEAVAAAAGAVAGRICPFCVDRFTTDDLLLEHMKAAHRGDMFGCGKCASSIQPAIAWSVDLLLQHLGNQHKLNVSISEAISTYTIIPSNLYRINCKLCLPPYLLGSEGFWLGRDLTTVMESVEKHFEDVHVITDKTQVAGKLELACRGCDVTFSASSRLEWAQHVRRDHERLNRPTQRAAGPSKRCDYCGEKILQTETIRHVKEAHRHETFQCKACLEADPTCFPYQDTIKEMMQHMVMKHGDQFSSYYDHMVYPVTLWGALCSDPACTTKGGTVLAYDAATIGRHLRHHQDRDGSQVAEFICRCCDRVKQKFKTIEEVKDHIAKRHKTVLQWRETNGNN